MEVNRCVGAQEIQLSRQWVVAKTQPPTTPSAPLPRFPTSLLPPLPQQPQDSSGGAFAWAPFHGFVTFSIKGDGDFTHLDTTQEIVAKFKTLN